MKGRSIMCLVFAGFALVGCQDSGDTPAEAPAEKTAEAPAPTSDAGWVVLFDGHDLSSFNQVGGANWNIVDDVVEATSGEAGYLVTKGTYGDVEVKLEFWTSPEANSGVFMRCQNPVEIGSRSCYEVNVFDQRPDQTYRTGSIVDIAEPLAQMDAANRWNTFDITMEGNHLMVTMNDTVMVDVENDEFAKGVIALQWSAGTVRFRNVMLRPL